jgi:hypothetical protein
VVQQTQPKVGCMHTQFLLRFVATAALLVGSAQAQLVPQPPPPPTSISFPMVVSAGAKPCLPNASGYVTIKTDGEAENLSHFDPRSLSPQTQALKAILERLEPHKAQPIPDTASTG